MEKWNAHARIRQDLFGFIDIVCVRDDRIVGIQATSGSNVSARITKIKANENLAAWLAAGGLVEVWGWRKLAKKIGRASWQARVISVDSL